MNDCRIYKDKRRLVRDILPTEPIKKVIRLAQTKLKEATTNEDKAILEKIIYIGKQILTRFKKWLPSSYLLKEYIKAHAQLLRLNIGIFSRKILMFTTAMLQKAYEQQRIKERSAEAAEAAKAAAEAAKAATEAAAKWMETDRAKNAFKKLGINKDSSELIKLYNDSMSILLSIKQLRRAIISRKHADDRRRISTTKTPSMWEIRYVLGIKPGVSFYEKDWKAYKENGFIVVENKRTGQKYQKPQSEVVAAANAERESKLNTADPYLNSGSIQYGGNDEFSSPQKKRSLRDILKKIGATIAAVTAVIAEIKRLHAGASGLGGILTNFTNGATNWIHTARETWREVNNAI